LNFVSVGGKLLIWDSECTNPVPDYSWLPFPFASSNPGQRGALAACTDLGIIEENTLSCSDPTQPCFVDTCTIATRTESVGDGNLLITGVAGWCIDMSAKNTLGSSGPIQAYAPFGNGLIVWNGFDMDNLPTSGVVAKVWELQLRQPFNPATGLP